MFLLKLNWYLLWFEDFKKSSDNTESQTISGENWPSDIIISSYVLDISLLRLAVPKERLSIYVMCQLINGWLLLLFRNIYQNC